MLGALLTAQITAFLLVFTRVGSGVMLMPGIGESYVSPTLRLAFALMVALVMMPALAPSLPAPPRTISGLAFLIVGEMTIGLFIGMLCRLIISALHVAGTVISMQSGLSSAQMFDLTQAAQGTQLGNLMSMAGVAFWFALDFHHLMFHALFDSYGLFLPGNFLAMGDGIEIFAHLMGGTFAIALQMTAPVMLVMLLVNIGGGVLSRLMPALQVFYLLLPLQILLTFEIMKWTADGMFLWFFQFAEEHLTTLLKP